MLVLNQWYSVTFAPSDGYQYFEETDRLIKFYDDLVYTLHNLLKDVSDYKLFPEISEKGRLHLHGDIAIRDIFTFLCDKYHAISKMCIMDVDTIDTSGIWFLYCGKQKYQGPCMLEQCQKKGLPYMISKKTMSVYDTNHGLRVLSNLDHKFIDMFERSKIRPKANK